MKEIKIISKGDMFGALGHQIHTKDKVYVAYQAYPDDEDYWYVESDFIVNEMPIYSWDYIKSHFYFIEELRAKKIDDLLKNN